MVDKYKSRMVVGEVQGGQRMAVAGMQMPWPLLM